MPRSKKQVVHMLVFSFVWSLLVNDDYIGYVKARIKKNKKKIAQYESEFPLINEIYDDFGDVREFRKASGLEKTKAVQRYTRLFNIQKGGSLIKRATVSTSEKSVSILESNETPNLTLEVGISKLPPKEELKKQLDSLIDKVYQTELITNSALVQQPKYLLQCKLNELAVRRVWKSIHIREAYINQELKKVENITKEVSKFIVANNRQHITRDILKHPFTENDIKRFDKYNDTMRVQIMRYRREGNNMIANILLGKFPEYKKL